MHSRYPLKTSGTWEGFGGRTWYAADRYLNFHHNSSLAIVFGRQDSNMRIVHDRRPIEEKMRDIARYYQTHKKWPPKGVTREGMDLARFRRNPECFTLLGEYGIPLRTPKESAEVRIRRVLLYQKKHGHLPRRSGKCQEWNDLTTLRKNPSYHAATLAAGIPLNEIHEPPRQRMVASLVAEVASLWVEKDVRPQQNSVGAVDGLSFNVLDRALRQGCYGIGGDLHRCRILSIADLRDEIEADCWLFKVHDCHQMVPWSRVQADKLRIDASVPARRTHFLRWNHQGKKRDRNPTRHKWVQP